MEVAGYVCNNTKCKRHGWAKYIEDDGPMTAPCPSCEEERTMLPVQEEVKDTGERMAMPAVKLNNGKYYG